MKKYLLLNMIFLLFVSFSTPNLYATETRGVRVLPILDKDGQKVGSYTGSYALLIGVSLYTSGWSNLESVPDDIERVETVLKSHGFHVRKIMNPDNKELKYAFERFINDYGYDEDNRLLFFYSGHGYSRKEGRKGYLVPSDAPIPQEDEKAFLRKSITMDDMHSLSRRIEAKHALFLFDSCLSGTIFESKVLPEQPLHISLYSAKPVRQFITAGSTGENVPAKSVFTPSFVKALSGEADINHDHYITGTELGVYINEQVLHYNTGQTPQYGKTKDPDLDEGDFVFVLGDDVYELQVPLPSNPEEVSYKTLSVAQVQSMPHISIHKKKFWGYYGHSTINHDYEVKTINRDSVVIDHATGLMWHQSGSDKYFTWYKAGLWLKGLNKMGYAGYYDWRLPTLEEAALLLEQDKHNELYIAPAFDKKQKWFWTGDKKDKTDGRWRVNFIESFVSWCWTRQSFNSFVRPVRTMK